jgi:hypothetical protein
MRPDKYTGYQILLDVALRSQRFSPTSEVWAPEQCDLSPGLGMKGWDIRTEFARSALVLALADLPRAGASDSGLARRDTRQTDLQVYGEESPLARSLQVRFGPTPDRGSLRTFLPQLARRNSSQASHSLTPCSWAWSS